MPPSSTNGSPIIHSGLDYQSPVGQLACPKHFIVIYPNQGYPGCPAAGVELDLVSMDNGLFKLPIPEQDREGKLAEYDRPPFPEQLPGSGRMAGVQWLLILV